MKTSFSQVRIDDPQAAIALLHPTRAKILTELREPASATEVARILGMPAARVNHHVKRLRDLGLVRRAGTRRVRNLTEILYASLARTFVIAEGLTPGGEQRTSLRQVDARRPLRNLVALGERFAGDAITLLDQAAWDDREFSTYATSIDLNFPDAGSRAAFLGDLLEAVRALKDRYGATETPAAEEERYKTIIACYPES